MDIVYQNKDFLVINKDNNLVIQKDNDGNSLEEILEKDALFPSLPRCGIVHRLDKQTTGTLLIAKNLPSLSFLTSLFKERKIKKVYLALLEGVLSVDSGEIKVNVQKIFSKNKIAMKKSEKKGKLAIVFFKVIER